MNHFKRLTMLEHPFKVELKHLEKICLCVLDVEET